MRPLLSLCLLVKNEAGSIRAVLEAVRPVIDRFTVLDTGSTDGTQDIIREALATLPGKLYEEAFEGFAKSRNRVLDLDRGCAGEPAVFTLTLSADEFVRDGDKLRAYLETQRNTNIDCHFVRLALDSGMSLQARILRTGSAWRYDDFGLGIHEVPVYTAGGDAPKQVATGGYIEHVVTDPIARMDNIWENHIPLLREALVRNPKDARAIEYLTRGLQSFFPFMEDDERKDTVAECVELYQRRFELPFSCDEEKRLLFMDFIDTARLGDDFTLDELFLMVDQFCQVDTSRPEHFYLRADIASKRGGMLVTEIYAYAREAAAVAERVRLQGGLTNSSPLDMSTEWKSHRLAAIAAMNLAKKYPENRQVMSDHIAAGLAVGGPWAAFKDIVLDDTAPVTPQPPQTTEERP